MIFSATLIAIVVAMLLMAFGAMFRRTALRKGCGEDCECLGGERPNRNP